MTDFMLSLNCRFTDYDKEKCLPAIERLIRLSESARRQGVLVLQTELEGESDIFLETAAGLVVDGIEPETVKEILQNMIIADGIFGAELLRKLIYTEGLLSIQQGDNPRIVRLKLCSMLGEKYVQRMRGIPMSDEISALLAALSGRAPTPESVPFESFLLRQDDHFIERVLRDVDGSCLISALHGCGIDLIRRITRCLSKYVAFQLCGELQTKEDGVSAEQILSAQKRILEVIDKLESYGEITVIRD